jgi:hypothetical protein
MASGSDKVGPLRRMVKESASYVSGNASEWNRYSTRPLSVVIPRFRACEEIPARFARFPAVLKKFPAN